MSKKSHGSPLHRGRRRVLIVAARQQRDRHSRTEFFKQYKPLLHRGIGEQLVSDIEHDQADISCGYASQIAGRGQFDDFKLGELSLEDAKDTCPRQDMMLDDHQHRRTVQSMG